MILKNLVTKLQPIINYIKSIKWTKSRRIAVASLAIALIAVLFLLSGINGSRAESIMIQSQKYEEKIIAAGQLQLAKETTLISEVSGEIETLGAAGGDVISAGSIIVSINDPDREFQLEQKKAGFDSADAQYRLLLDFDYDTAKADLVSQSSKKDQAKKSYDAAVELYRQGAIPQLDYLQYKADYEAALAAWNTAKLRVQSLEEGGALRSSSKAQLLSAKASYESALSEQMKYQITVPWDSVVLKTYVDEHDYVQPGDKLADIGEAGSYHVVTELDEKYFPFLSKGMKAMIYVGDPGKSKGAEGNIDIISPKINSETGTFEVKIGLPDEFPYLASDLTVNVEIVIKESKTAIVIPEGYLIKQESSVFLYKNGKAVKTDIRYEAGPSSNLFVTNGIKEGDIIIKPDSSIQDGKAVKVSKGDEAS